MNQISRSTAPPLQIWRFVPYFKSNGAPQSPSLIASRRDPPSSSKTHPKMHETSFFLSFLLKSSFKKSASPADWQVISKYALSESKSAPKVDCKFAGRVSHFTCWGPSSVLTILGFQQHPAVDPAKDFETLVRFLQRAETTQYLGTALISLRNFLIGTWISDSSAYKVHTQNQPYRASAQLRFRPVSGEGTRGEFSVFYPRKVVHLTHVIRLGLNRFRMYQDSQRVPGRLPGNRSIQYHDYTISVSPQYS